MTKVLEMLIMVGFGTASMFICEKTIWRGWPTIARDWGWKQWLKWFIYPGFYLGLGFVFFATLAVMKTVRDLWFQG